MEKTEIVELLSKLTKAVEALEDEDTQEPEYPKYWVYTYNAGDNVYYKDYGATHVRLWDWDTSEVAFVQGSVRIDSVPSTAEAFNLVLLRSVSLSDSVKQAIIDDNGE